MKREPEPPEEATTRPMCHIPPHTRLRALSTFSYCRGETVLARFFKDEYVNATDPLVLKAWADYPTMFEAEHIS
jgi:hypothetical protein